MPDKRKLKKKYHGLESPEALKLLDLDQDAPLSGMISYPDLVKAPGVSKRLLDIGISAGFIKPKRLKGLLYPGYINMESYPIWLERIGVDQELPKDVILNSYHNLDSKADMAQWKQDQTIIIKGVAVPEGYVSYIEFIKKKHVLKSIVDSGVELNFIRYYSLEGFNYRGYIKHSDYDIWSRKLQIYFDGENHVVSLVEEILKKYLSP